ncbi:hypothetical protein [Haliscomenobacter sp.]|uniref:hypothetical protein n=1 Tax=Haliscomenobacter sp. TaxID=2717303 RepID=UPI003364B557
MAQFRPYKNGTGQGIVYIEKVNLNPDSIEGKALTLFRVEGWWKNSADFVVAEFRTKTARPCGIDRPELVQPIDWININKSAKVRQCAKAELYIQAFDTMLKWESWFEFERCKAKILSFRRA